ncbi:HAD-superfamily hydrolase, subfamily IA, variant 3 [Candidatus Vecturithrix granuli]|uniref:HAD-superfamily hydrolase, subfamily IA, variant 3 n=1 Tax=Vecturithrix granuli TaxID=1499967 RepID=A0A081C9U0_VECG1|nr:HAD-superfamily hydrolase, subfamily IA, variant 3 [Candidatus Vecturithrix granuli]
MKTCCIVDMGGVMVTNHDVTPAVAAHLGLSAAQVRDYSNEYVIALMEGKITTAMFWELFTERCGIVVQEELLGKFFHPIRNEAMYKFIQKLKQTHRVVCGTNSIEEHYAFHLARGDYDVFDIIYPSHKIGVAKPQAAFYAYILEQEHCIPSQALFIDDLLENVEAARRLGIRAFHFTNDKTLKAQMFSEGEMSF